jgi:hypothetical protein
MTPFGIDLFSIPFGFISFRLTPLLINLRKWKGDERGEDPDLFC